MFQLQRVFQFSVSVIIFQSFRYSVFSFLNCFLVFSSKFAVLHFSTSVIQFSRLSALKLAVLHFFSFSYSIFNYPDCFPIFSAQKCTAFHFSSFSYSVFQIIIQFFISKSRSFHFFSFSFLDGFLVFQPSNSQLFIPQLQFLVFQIVSRFAALNFAAFHSTSFSFQFSRLFPVFISQIHSFSFIQLKLFTFSFFYCFLVFQPSNSQLFISSFQISASQIVFCFFGSQIRSFLFLQFFEISFVHRRCHTSTRQCRTPLG